MSQSQSQSNASKAVTVGLTNILAKVVKLGFKGHRKPMANFLTFELWSTR